MNTIKIPSGISDEYVVGHIVELVDGKNGHLVVNLKTIMRLLRCTNNVFILTQTGYAFYGVMPLILDNTLPNYEVMFIEDKNNE